jgi:hypothetical protein
MLTDWGAAFTDKAFYLSFLGIRFTPDLFYYFSPAWWYFGLIIQLYLLFPLLWNGLRRFGPSRLLILTGIISFSIRGLGLLYFSSYLDVWQRGGIFITRLPEFVFGISFAAWLFQHREQLTQKLRSPWVMIGSVVVYLTGLGLSLTLMGMTFAPFLLGISLFMILYILLERLIPHMPAWLARLGEWIGGHSYSLYLMHHPIILRLIPMGALLTITLVARSFAALLLTIITAIALEWGMALITRSIQKQLLSFGVVKTVLRSVLGCFVFAASLIGGELIVRRFAPQEILGWGERASLQPDDLLGWRLIPSRETRLRWLSYDYTVSANQLGFPGTDFPEEKSPGTFRIMVAGDAFSSAEGVDTNQAWPHLLQNQLSGASGANVEVLNFAITGYGPNQYASVVETYAPIYRPDLVIVEVFVNDFYDVLTSNDQFQDSIGFNQPDQNGLGSMIRLEHLRRFLRINVAEPVGEFLLNKPNANGYFLGNFASFERDQTDLIESGSQLLVERLRLIKSVVGENNSDLLVIMVPASIQVCDADQLDYYPVNVDFADSEIYDSELPQRMFGQISDELGITFLDLRDAFRDLAECPYQPRNMHWTTNGHLIVTDYLTGIFQMNGYLP